ncbi:nucleoside phosphorylase [Herbiconiux sp. L3-i23]|uniref:nucleoside phosphorylase n=1 Tax=Herbiconiux sp. L3-i23 TaxID=2905871 RepID=UPI0020617462|nr:nucleoside phosphorylase [Herbiconiux sp. L3-i23]BDI23990.1 uridine phosphorylase [Herbiconiux sp. L3-i23]
MSSKNAWYLRCSADEVGASAVLVGDRGRVHLAAELMEGSVLLNEDRGLTTATGYYEGERITVSAFGMGAPIAAVVMHELADLGVKRFVRLGTVMTVGETQLGELVVAHGAIRGESTSASYLPVEYPAVPDFALTAQLEAAVRAAGQPTRSGIYATYDGFYTEMFDTGVGVERVADRYARLAKVGVVAADMETSALFVAARALGVAAGSLCLASVAGTTNEKMAHADRVRSEAELLKAGFTALAASAMPAGV